jgi:hypothetical protein
MQRGFEPPHGMTRKTLPSLGWGCFHFGKNDIGQNDRDWKGGCWFHRWADLSLDRERGFWAGKVSLPSPPCAACRTLWRGLRGLGT